MLDIAAHIAQLIGISLMCYMWFTLAKRIDTLENSNIDARLRGVEMELHATADATKKEEVIS